MGRDARLLRDERIGDLVQAGWDAYYSGRERWLRSVLARLKGLTPDLPEVVDLQWRLLYLQGRLDEAMEEAQRGAALHPDDPALQHSVGWCLLELRDADAAVPYLERCCQLDAEAADAWYDLAIARERLNDEPGAQGAFTRVWELDLAAAKSTPLVFPHDQFEDILRGAIGELHPEVLESMANVVVIHEEYPDAWILEAPPYDPRLFGLFVGPVLADIRGAGTSGEEPSRIYLFQRNLERQFGHPADLAAEIRITLIHEVGHYLGLEEGDLADRGWL
jgi:predicted Zn-dependent protease with MMP-like domain